MKDECKYYASSLARYVLHLFIKFRKYVMTWCKREINNFDNHI